MTNNQSGGSSGGSGDQKKKTPEVKDMILGAMRSRSGKETTKWIARLTSEGMQEIESAASSAPAAPGLPAQFAHPSIAQTQVKWVDKLFDLLQQYEVEFNRANQVPDLRVGTERPIITSDLVARLQGSDQHHYSGRLHTRFWTLAVRGNLSHIEAYVIPSDHFIGFEKNIAKYNQLFEFIPVFDGELKWSFGNGKGAIGLNQLNSMTKLIFGHLVMVAKGDIDSEEPFSYGLSSPTRKTVDGVPASQAASGAAGSSSYLMKHSGVFEDDDALQSASFNEGGSTDFEDDEVAEAIAGKWNEGSDLKTGANGSAGTVIKAGPAATAGAVESDEAESAASDLAPSASAAARLHNEAAASAEATTISGATGLTRVGSESVTIAEACEILARAVGSELDALSKAGARAFEEHDFAAVEKLMKRTARVKSMHERINAAIDEWKKMLAD